MSNHKETNEVVVFNGGKWNHLMIVRENGKTTHYCNGEQTLICWGTQTSHDFYLGDSWLRPLQYHLGQLEFSFVRDELDNAGIKR